MELVRLRPRDSAAWQSLGSALGLSGRKGEAVEAFATAAALEPESGEAQVRLGFAAAGAGDRAGAARALERASRLFPAGSFRHGCALGVLLDDLDSVDRARTWLEACGRDEPEFAEARFRLARRLVVAREVERARSALVDAIRADPALTARARADRDLARLLE
jgi:tetratricopeptide (TPR) repeat protein